MAEPLEVSGGCDVGVMPGPACCREYGAWVAPTLLAAGRIRQLVTLDGVYAHEHRDPAG